MFNADGEAYLDLTSRPTLYLGMIDVYPTSSTSACSGELSVRLSEEYRNYHIFFNIEKLYINNIDILDGKDYILPGIGKYFDDNSKEVYFKWGYRSASNQVNIPARVRFGVY